MTLGARLQVDLARAARSALWVAAFGFGLFSLLIARSHPGGSFGGVSWVAATAELAAGWATLGAGLHLCLRRPGNRSGYLLAAAGVVWFFVEWNNPGIGSSVVFTFGLVAYAMALPMVAYAVLAYPSGGPLSRPERLTLATAYVGTGLVLGLLPALFFDPHRQGCNLCPANLLLFHSSEGVVRALTRWGVRLGVVWTIALAALLVWRLVRTSAPLRKVTGPVLVAGIGYLLLVWVDYVHSLSSGILSTDPFEYRLRLGEAAALGALALAVLWSWFLGRRTRSAMARLVVELGESPPPGRLREVLAQTLGDPQLQVAYPLGESDRLVDASGRTVDLAARDGKAVTPLARNGTMVALLLHRQGLLDDPGLVEEVAAAARLALENERLQAEVRAQLEDLRTSRARIVATGDVERRRLERDLHDGAQQRLVGLLLALRLVRAEVGQDQDPGFVSQIDRAEEGLRLAIEELRELAHGIYPAVLADEGLAAAVEALAERASIPIQVVAIPEGRFANPTEAAAYFLVAEATGPIAALTAASGTKVVVEHDGDRLLVEVTEDGAADPRADVESRVTDLADRLGALNGRLLIERRPGRGVTIRAEIPCGS
ncbi:MAG: histidine kinase [Actinomycetota bacterium]|nr:histidine kinase [Actinomycetota bacterium]